MSDAEKSLTYEVWDPQRSTDEHAEWVPAMNANEAARQFAWADQQESHEDLYGAGRLLMVRSPNGAYRYLVRRVMADVVATLLFPPREKKGTPSQGRRR